ncbi:MAG: Hsp20/alpha crystallin family protein [Candidatus Kariarchaeaceae archaeon]
MRFKRKYRKWMRAPVMGGHWRLRQLRQFDFGFQYEENNKLRVVVPLPGIDKESLQVKAKENLVSISVSVAEQFRKYAARPEDSWDIVLDFEVLPETAKAKYVDGILTVDLDLKYPASDVDKIVYD